jgi:unsaturated pyranuronate lyase
MPQKFTDLLSIDARELAPGALAQPITGRNVQLVRTEIQPGCVFAPHRHPHEQFILVIDGAIEFDIDGEQRALGPMGVFYFEPGALHGARVVGDEPVSLIEVFAPPREDYRDGHGTIAHDAPG